METSVQTKVCIKCGEDKELEKFQIHRSSGNRRNVCHECQRLQKREYTRTQNKELVSKRKKEWTERNKEKIKEYSKRYYELNSESMNEYTKKIIGENNHIFNN